MIIVERAYGQLCNQLFTLSNLIAFACEHHQTVICPDFSVFADSFDYFKGESVSKFPREDANGPICSFGLQGRQSIRVWCKLLRRVYPACWIHLGDRGVLDLDDLNNRSTARLASSSLSIASGFYFVGKKTFSKHAERVRDVFRPSAEIRARVDAVEKRGREGIDVLVGVHVRQGDYRTFSNGLSFFSSEEYADILRRIVKLFPDKRARFLVCSNENQQGKFEGLDVMFGPGDPLGDLYSLARCDYLIGPGSTFTQWASFFGSVPRYVMAWKWEAEYNLPQTPLTLDGFRVHVAGFGSQVNDRGETC
jgi:hypothetical protein